jgi:heme-degrading monooxygenase HmoA
MAPFIIDLEHHPELQFRIDNFNVPAAAREEFEAAMHRNLAFLQTLPGFLWHLAFEQTSGDSHYNLVTIAVWESPDALEKAGEAVRAYYQGIGFNLLAMLKQWGVAAERGNYHAPRSLQ